VLELLTRQRGQRGLLHPMLSLSGRRYEGCQ
jgi:hypothetical protein